MCRRQVFYWNRCILDGDDLSGLDLTGSVIRDTSIKRGKLVGSILENIDGRRAKFVSADLTSVRLAGRQFGRLGLHQSNDARR